MNDGNFEGVTGWESEPTTLKSVIIRSEGKVLALDFDYQGYKYTATLHLHDNGRYEGEYQSSQGAQAYIGRASCRLFEDGDDIFLFGRWYEESSTFTWWGEFQSLN